MKNFLKDLVSNQNLLITAFFSLTTLLLGIIQLVLNGSKNRHDERMEKLKLNYSNKLDCYSKLLSMFADKSSKLSKGNERTSHLSYLIPEAYMLCDPETRPKIEKLLEEYLKYQKDGQNDAFDSAFKECFISMEKEMNNFNNKKTNYSTVKAVLVTFFLTFAISNVHKIYNLVAKLLT